MTDGEAFFGSGLDCTIDPVVWPRAILRVTVRDDLGNTVRHKRSRRLTR